MQRKQPQTRWRAFVGVAFAGLLGSTPLGCDGLSMRATADVTGDTVVVTVSSEGEPPIRFEVNGVSREVDNHEAYFVFRADELKPGPTTWEIKTAQGGKSGSGEVTFDAPDSGAKAAHFIAIDCVYLADRPSLRFEGALTSSDSIALCAVEDNAFELIYVAPSGQPVRLGGAELKGKAADDHAPHVAKVGVFEMLGDSQVKGLSEFDIDVAVAGKAVGKLHLNDHNAVVPRLFEEALQAFQKGAALPFGSDAGKAVLVASGERGLRGAYTIPADRPLNDVGGVALIVDQPAREGRDCGLYEGPNGSVASGSLRLIDREIRLLGRDGKERGKQLFKASEECPATLRGSEGSTELGTTNYPDEEAVQAWLQQQLASADKPADDAAAAD